MGHRIDSCAIAIFRSRFAIGFSKYCAEVAGRDFSDRLSQLNISTKKAQVKAKPAKAKATPAKAKKSQAKKGKSESRAPAMKTEE